MVTIRDVEVSSRSRASDHREVPSGPAHDAVWHQTCSGRPVAQVDTHGPDQQFGPVWATASTSTRSQVIVAPMQRTKMAQSFLCITNDRAWGPEVPILTAQGSSSARSRALTTEPDARSRDTAGCPLPAFGVTPIRPCKCKRYIFAHTAPNNMPSLAPPSASIPRSNAFSIVSCFIMSTFFCLF